MGFATRLGATVLATALVAGCGGETAAPANVEGTVQARVSATVAALVRVQPTPTRPPPGTTVVPISSPALSPAAGTVPVGTPFATAVTPSSATSTAAATSGATAAATTATTAVATTPAATGAVLALGAVAPIGGLSLTINRYEWNTNCPAGGGRAAAGMKFVVIQAVGRNDGSTLATPAAAQWAVENVPAGSSVPCRPEGRPFDEACYRSGPIGAGARCEGWVLFEVPEQLSVPGATVTARGSGQSAESARWRLPA